MNLRGTEGNTPSLFTPEALLPSQYFAPSFPQTPCHKLIGALFDKAIEELEAVAYMNDIRAVKRWNEGVAWLLSSVETYGSFVFCCRHLGCDENAARAALGKRYSLVIRDLPPPKSTHPRRVVLDRSPVSYPGTTIKCFRKNRFYVVFEDGLGCWVTRRNLTDDNTIWNVKEKGTLVVNWRGSRTIAKYKHPSPPLEEGELL